jgi:hypothetical protein
MEGDLKKIKPYRMNIYKVELPKDLYLGPKTYYEYVIISKSEDDARNSNPECLSHEWVKECDRHRLVITKIGKADEKYKNYEIICRSFIDE